MSNTLALMQAQLPANLAALAGFTGADDLSSGVSGGFGVVSIRGSKWRVVEGGEEKPIYIPGTKDLAPSIKAVLVKANPAVSKVYYAGAYVEGSDAKPDCTSADGVKPDTDSAKPQCASCAACPHNQWGSKITPSGSKTKACADVRRVAIIPADDMSTPPMLLRVPAASLADLAAYGRNLKKAGVPYAAVSTRLAFDPNAAYPKITFDFDRVLTAEEIEVVAALQDDPRVEDVIGGALPVMDAPAPEAPASAPAPAPAPAAAAPAPTARVRRTPAPAPAPAAEPAPAPAPVSNVVQMPTQAAPAPSEPVVAAGNIAGDIADALAGLSL